MLIALRQIDLRHVLRLYCNRKLKLNVLLTSGEYTYRQYIYGKSRPALTYRPTVNVIGTGDFSEFNTYACCKVVHDDSRDVDRCELGGGRLKLPQTQLPPKRNSVRRSYSIYAILQTCTSDVSQRIQLD